MSHNAIVPLYLRFFSYSLVVLTMYLQLFYLLVMHPDMHLLMVACLLGLICTLCNLLTECIQVRCWPHCHGQPIPQRLHRLPLPYMAIAGVVGTMGDGDGEFSSLLFTTGCARGLVTLGVLDNRPRGALAVAPLLGGTVMESAEVYPGDFSASCAGMDATAGPVILAASA